MVIARVGASELFIAHGRQGSMGRAASCQLWIHDHTFKHDCGGGQQDRSYCI